MAVQLKVPLSMLIPEPSATNGLLRNPIPKYLRVFSAELSARLRSGSHLILYGPRGSGKSTLLAAMRDDYRERLIPCAIAAQTSGLPDVVTALSQAYPEVDVEGLGRRAIGLRLRMTADRLSGVLLLDHTREVTTAMVGFLRRIRGGILGALIVVDIDSDFERERLRAWCRHAQCVRMPLITNRCLRHLLLSQCVASSLPAIESKGVHHIIQAARGRVGWLDECMRRLQMPKYWKGGHLHIGGLCTDTEIAIREGGCGPRMSRRAIRSHISA